MGSEKKTFNWKLFFILWVMVIIGLLGVIPYTLTLQAEQLDRIQLPMPISLLVTIQVIITSLIYGILTGLGILIAKKINLGLPFLEAILQKRKTAGSFQKIIIISTIAGLAAGFVILALDTWVFNLERINVSLPSSVKPPAWQGFLASFYGGIVEEILLRLFLFSLLAWLGNFIIKSDSLAPRLQVLWIANILAAVIFGIGHLPTAVVIGLPLNTFIVIRTLILNGIGGLVFGWLYWTYGLESAMIAHFPADLLLHVLVA